jgi:hypothetical protein
MGAIMPAPKDPEKYKIWHEKLKNRVPGMLGKHHSEEAIEKLSIANMGQKPSTEVREKMRFAHLGKKHSEETKRKIGESQRANKQIRISELRRLLREQVYEFNENDL